MGGKHEFIAGNPCETYETQLHMAWDHDMPKMQAYLTNTAVCGKPQKQPKWVYSI